MSHLSDKELDRLSREAAEQFDVEGSTSGWDALEKKLDTAMPAGTTNKRRRGLWFWLTGSLLLIGLLGYYFYADKDTPVSGNKETIKSQPDGSKFSKENSADRINSTSDPETDLSRKAQPSKANSNIVSGSQENNQPGTDLKNSIPQDGNSNKQQNNNLTAANKSITEFKNKNRKSSNTSQNQIRNSFNDNKRGLVESSTDAPNVNYNSSESESSREKSLNDQSGTFSKSSGDLITKNENPEPDFIKQTILPGIDHQHNPIIIQNSTQADSMMANLANSASPERDTTVKQNTLFPFEVGMLVGSDMSNVNFQGSDRVGLNFGISVGYRFNKRWQINTGLIYTKKYYQARGKDFHPPKGYWTDYVKLDLVAGNCSMWEIPLNVRYDLSLARKGSWFIATGLSTYFMQQEDYDYHYWSNGNYYTRHKGYPSTEKSILGILNLSGGFEKNFTPHVSVQIEPYMRIPLKGLGFGNMQMNSFGTNFILKFKSGPAKK